MYAYRINRCSKPCRVHVYNSYTRRRLEGSNELKVLFEFSTAFSVLSDCAWLTGEWRAICLANVKKEKGKEEMGGFRVFIRVVKNWTRAFFFSVLLL